MSTAEASAYPSGTSSYPAGATAMASGTTVPVGYATPEGGPPYALPVVGLGGFPDTTTDVPVTSVFLVLYFIAGFIHWRIFKKNKLRNHFFKTTRLLFFFCMMRIVSTALRIAWAENPDNVNIQIAAEILTSAGVVMLYMVNLVFLHRLCRSLHPKFGWHPLLYKLFRAFHMSILAIVVAVISCTVDYFYTLDADARKKDHDVQLTGITYFTVACGITIPLTLLCTFWPKKGPIDNFGTGSYSTKIYILLASSSVLMFGAVWKCWTQFAGQDTAATPWYDTKAWFYCVTFVPEIIVVYGYAIVRVDNRFYVPDGAKGPGDYSLRTEAKKRQAQQSGNSSSMAEQGFGSFATGGNSLATSSFATGNKSLATAGSFATGGASLASGGAPSFATGGKSLATAGSFATGGNSLASAPSFATGGKSLATAGSFATGGKAVSSPATAPSFATGGKSLATGPSFATGGNSLASAPSFATGGKSLTTGNYGINSSPAANTYQMVDLESTQKQADAMRSDTWASHAETEVDGDSLSINEKEGKEDYEDLVHEYERHSPDFSEQPQGHQFIN